MSSVWINSIWVTLSLPYNVNCAPASGFFAPVYLNTGTPNVYVYVFASLDVLSLPYVNQVLFSFASTLLLVNVIAASFVKVAEYDTKIL